MSCYAKSITGGGPTRRRLLVAALLVLVGRVECHSAQDDDNPAFPLVVRVSESFFASSEPEVDEQRKVNVCTLGIRNRGTAVVVGHLQPRFVTESESARLELLFAGTTVSRTVGREGPAIIRSENHCRFQLAAPVSFDLERGFFAGDVTGDVEVTSMSQRVSATVPGLRKRIVLRVAHKRLQEKRSQIKRIAKENNRQRLLASMDERLKERLGELNERWFELRGKLEQQPWYDQAPHLYVATTDAHLLVFVAPGSTKPKPEFPGLAFYPLPTSAAESKAELLVRTDMLNLGEEAQGIVEVLERSNSPLAVILGQAAKATITAENASPWSVFQLDLTESPAVPTAVEPSTVEQ